MKRFSIRKAAIGDIEKVCDLESHWVKEGITYGLVESTEEDFIECLKGYFLVAEMDSRMVGFIAGGTKKSDGLAVVPHGEKYAEIDHLYVKPDCRDEGIGKKLVERFDEAVHKNGIKYVTAFTATKDVRRILGVYETHGFKGWGMQLFKKL